jgi:hypothetical protein
MKGKIIHGYSFIITGPVSLSLLQGRISDVSKYAQGLKNIILRDVSI